jgi:hypothetical protein
VEKQLPRVSVAFLIATLLFIAGSKTEAQVKQTLGIKTLTLGVAYEREPEVGGRTFSSSGAICR